MDFARDAFWGNDYDRNPKLTPASVAAAERFLGVTLPLEYVNLLKVQNGGYTLGFVFPTAVRTAWAVDHVALDDMSGIGAMEDLPSGLHNILNTEYMTREWDLPPNQVLLTGDGHWWITLDYRTGEQPSVSWIDVDQDEDLILAPSFSAFLKGLLPKSVLDENDRIRPQG